MSFSSQVKNELSSRGLESVSSCKSELMGLVRTNGTVTINFQGDVSLKFETTAGFIARRIFRIIKYLYNYDCEISVINDDQLRKKNLYQVRIRDEITRFLLEDTGFVLGDFGYLRPKDSFKLKNYAKAEDFLRGAFLGAGSITEPSKGYHLEIVCETQDSAEEIKLMGKTSGIDFKSMARKECIVLYLKNGDTISDFLSLVGANKAILEFENVRAMKDVKNSVNRIVNAETSNINKTVTTAVRQIEAIEKIQASLGLEALEVPLREIAIARLANPNDSLKELGEKLPTPLGKSGVNHRLKKIEDLARDL